MIKKKLFKYGSVFMCAALMACSLAACTTNSAKNQENTNAVVSCTDTEAESETLIQEVITSQLSAPKIATADTANSKEETVFVFTNAQGKQDHVIVNEKLKNAEGKSVIKDVTNLSDIVNLSGEEKSTGQGSNLSWEAEGNSITYQGTTTQSAPVTMKITYYLDGKEIKAEDLVGKSGKVTMRFDYTNNEKKTITVNGKSKQVYVPFTMVTGMVLPSDKFTDIEVTNGKLTQVNDSNVVYGITMPGLKESLNLKLDNKDLDLDIPEYFEVTANVTDFELEMTMSMATSNFLSDIDTDDFTLDDLKAKTDELQEAADKLTDGTQQLADATPDLVNGAKALAEGTNELNSKVPELTDGITKLDDGAGKLSQGTSQFTAQMPTLTSGISQLYSGSGELFKGTQSLRDGLNQLKAGTEKLTDEQTGLPALQSGINKYTNGVELSAEGSGQLKDGSAQLEAGLQQLNGKLTGENGLMDGMVKLAEGSESVSNGLVQLSDALDKSISDYEANAAQLKALAQSLEGAGAGFNTVLSSLDSNLVIQPYTDMCSGNELTSDIQSQLADKYMKAYAYAVEHKEDNPVIVQINAGIAASEQLKAAGINELSDVYEKEMLILINTAANESAGKVEKSVSGSVAQLKDGAAQVSAGLKSAAAQKDELKTALGKLVEGSSQVAAGSTQLNSGLSELKSNNDTLNNGIAGAVSGAKQLDEGLGKVTSESGISALVTGAESLKNGIGTLSESSTTLVQGVNALDDGAKQLKLGTAQLLSGAGALANGINQLNDGAGQLADGAEQLNNGVVELRDGMVQFNEEGISQITSLVGDDAENAVETIKSVIKLGQEYQSFAGKSADIDGSVTFIYKTEGITK